jgi:Cft2 family RNA processing exonuclease
MEITLHPAGHVLGANMVELKTKSTTLLYTGDFCTHNTEILDGASPEKLPKEPDVLIMESTYGGRIRRKRAELVEMLISKSIKTMERGGNILLPAFAFHRLQEMTKRIDFALRENILPHYNAYYVSGLARRITHYYNDHKHQLSKPLRDQVNPFSFTKVRPLKQIKHIQEPAIVICTSGFGHAGASHSLLLEWADNIDNTIIINSGYLPPTSPLEMAKTGRIENNGESINVNADVEQIELSGHADQAELVEFVKTLRPKQTFLVHGNLDQAQALSEKITGLTDVQIPQKNESFRI